MTTIDYAPLAGDTLADPYPMYRRLQEKGPVVWGETMGGWVVTGFDQAALALSDEHFSAADRPPQRSGQPTTMVTADPPEHTRLRRLVSQAFTARAVEAMRPRIQAIVDGLLDEVDGDRMDVARDLAAHLPIMVIAEMLAVPAEKRETFRRWTDEGMMAIIGRHASAEDKARMQRSGRELRDYFIEVIAERRRNPGDDLISALIAAEDEGRAMNDAEVMDNCTLLLTAGNETTTSLIANGVYQLLRHPGQLDRLRREPSLLNGAVEEMLRYDPAVHCVTRRVKHSIELDGAALQPKQVVFAVIAAANRDPTQFDRPDEFDIGRHPNPHLGFGDGMHFCLGAPLARAEAQIATEALVERFPKMKLAGEARYEGHFILRRVTELPVSL